MIRVFKSISNMLKHRWPDEDRAELAEYLDKHEGYRQYVYLCPADKWTVGIGRNIDAAGGKGITRAEALYLLNNDIIECLEDLRRIFPEWDTYPRQVRLALVDVRFQLGPDGFRGFKNTISAVWLRHWREAAAHLLDSKYAKIDTPGRALENADLIRTAKG